MTGTGRVEEISGSPALVGDVVVPTTGSTLLDARCPEGDSAFSLHAIANAATHTGTMFTMRM
jgi:hypothetical protein